MASLEVIDPPPTIQHADTIEVTGSEDLSAKSLPPQEADLNLSNAPSPVLSNQEISSSSVLDPKFSWVAPPELILNCAMESLMPSPGRFMESSESPRISLSEEFIIGENLMAKSTTSKAISNCVELRLDQSSRVNKTDVTTSALAKDKSKLSQICSPSVTASPPASGAWASPFKIAALFPDSMNNIAHSFQNSEEMHSSILRQEEHWPSLASTKQLTRKRSTLGTVNPPLNLVSSKDKMKPLSQDTIKASLEYPWAAKMKSVCNLHRVTTPVYMEDGTPKVSIPSHVLLEGIENQNQFVVGQFYRCKAPSGGLIHAVATRIWGKKCRIFTRKLGESSYLFHIPDEATRKWVIQRGIWHVDDCLMFVSPWSPSPTISLPEISSIPVWLTLKNIPYQLYSIKGIDWIASGIGEPMLTSKPWLDPTQMGEAKILVEVKLNKPFPQRVALEDESGSISMVDVLYSWLPSKCGCCGQLGHKATHCLSTSGSDLVNASKAGFSTVNVAVESPSRVFEATVPTVVNSAITTVGNQKSVTETVPLPASPTGNGSPTIQTKSNSTTTKEVSLEGTCTPATFAITCSSMADAVVQPTTFLSETISCSKDALVINESETSHIISSPLITSASGPSLIVDQQGNNNLSHNPLVLDTFLHISGETSICVSKDKEEDSVGVLGNPFAILNSESFIDDSSFQFSRGGRHIKPTQKAQEMLLTKVRGRRGRGRG